MGTLRYESGSGDVSLYISAAWLAAGENADLARWLDTNGFEAERVDDHVLLHFSAADWARLGTPPERGADTEAADQWRHDHASVARTLGVGGQKVDVASVGYLGAESFAPSVSIDGVAYDLTEATPARHPVDLLPATFAIVTRCRAYLEGPRTRAAQIALVGDLQEVAAKLARAFEGSLSPVTLGLDEHLASQKFERVERAAITWDVSGRKGDIYALGVEYTRPDGSVAKLPPASVDPEAPVASLSATEHLLLADDVATVTRVAKAHRNKLRGKVIDALADPKSILPEGHTYDRIDFSRYSPRVLGFVPVVRADRDADVRSSGVQWLGRDDDPSIPFLRIDVARPDGTQATLTFDSPETAQDFVTRAEGAMAAGGSSPVHHDGVDVLPTAPLVDRVREDLALFDRLAPNREARPGDVSPDAGEPAAKTPQMAAVIAETKDEKALDAAAPEVDESAVPWDLLSAMLAPGIALKPHQREGIAWLWHHYQHEKPGVLLADDMGLGKTLQVACFLALMRAAGREADRARPSLVVAPVILLENWNRETERFFRPEVFASLYVLYDRGLRPRVDNGRLDLRGLPEHSVLLTNYDTLSRYQQHLLTLDYAAVVLDEAQAVKNPDALRTLAARGLKRSFAICATGTPVENRLLDLWSLYDVLSPGQPFATRARFVSEYEDHPDAIPKLRSALALPSRRSTLLRRTKAEALSSLPKKEEHVHAVPMTSQQLSQERLIAQSGRPVLEILHHLQKLYQHPRLLLRAEQAEQRAWSPKEIIAESPKLAKVIELLRDVRERGEKALVFTVWTAMQDLLARLLETELDLPRVRILNGAANQNRRAQQYLDELETTPGFSVLILSPIAAGTGLTITAANHVIHYGRWWNPAKEDQATDRAYRIGQTRDVHVHYPILHHPGAPDAGFDTKLHELVARKRSMARDFLDPAQTEDITAAELAQSLREGA